MFSVRSCSFCPGYSSVYSLLACIVEVMCRSDHIVCLQYIYHFCILYSESQTTSPVLALDLEFVIFWNCDC